MAMADAHNRVLLSRNPKQLAGKTVAEVVPIGSYDDSDLIMCEAIEIRFTDGTRLHLALDWRGAECYISEYKLPETP